MKRDGFSSPAFHMHADSWVPTRGGAAGACSRAWDQAPQKTDPPNVNMCSGPGKKICPAGYFRSGRSTSYSYKPMHLQATFSSPPWEAWVTLSMAQGTPIQPMLLQFQQHACWSGAWIGYTHQIQTCSMTVQLPSWKTNEVGGRGPRGRRTPSENGCREGV